MNRTHRTSLIVGLVTVVVIGVLVGGYITVGALLAPQATVENTEIAGVIDSDQDGLPDQFEPRYQTNPLVADTDQDGTDDLAEITAGRDPLTPGPNDTTGPATGSAVVDTSTLTGQYLASLPDDASRTDILDQDRIAAFISTRQGELLPAIDATTFTVVPETTAETVAAYLASISASHNTNLHAITNDAIAAAVEDQLQLNAESLTTLISQLEHNRDTLTTAPVPADLVELHTTVVAATEALLTYTRQLANIDTDFIGGLIAAQQVDALGTIWQEIATSVAELEATYDLE